MLPHPLIDGQGCMQKFCNGGGRNLGYLKKRGAQLQLQAVSEGALEDNVKQDAR